VVSKLAFSPLNNNITLVQDAENILYAFDKSSKYLLFFVYV
jgi:hypothetical protein